MKYGFKPQKRDDRDLMYSAAKPLAGLPSKSDLRNQLPDCWDQLLTSSCTAHGITAALWSGQVIAGQIPIMPSRLFLYYNERKLEGDTGKDDGAEIRDGIKVCNINGIVPENLWSFDESKVLSQPPDYAYQKALLNRIHFYASVNLLNLDQIRLALSHKLPVVFGFLVPQFFESNEMSTNGILKMPLSDTDIAGAHCTAIVGHDDTIKMFLIRNSWSVNWGIKGYFWMPYEYFEKSLCSDGWVIRMK